MEFITLELTKKLKEKGFDYKRVSLYDRHKCVNTHYVTPTIAQALKWLREKKNLHIEIVSLAIGYCYTISKTPPLGTDIYGSGVYDDYYDTYEQCVLSAIEYVLDNLI